MDDAPTPAATANDRLVREFMAAWEQRDSDFIIACFTEDAVYHSMPLNPVVGKEAIAAWIRGFEDVPPGRLEIHNQVASDDIVMNERTDRIVLNGHPVTLPIAGVFEMREGRICAWREYFDLAPARDAYRRTTSGSTELVEITSSRPGALSWTRGCRDKPLGGPADLRCST